MRRGGLYSARTLKEKRTALNNREVLALVSLTVVVSGFLGFQIRASLVSSPLGAMEAIGPVTTASYVISVEGSTVYARSGATGETVYSGTDAAAVLQDVTDALTNGGRIFIRSGTYRITKTISLGDKVVVEGESVGHHATNAGVVLEQAVDNHLITISNRIFCGLSHLTLHGRKDLYASGKGILINGSFGSGYHYIEDVYIDNFKENGFEVQSEVTEVFAQRIISNNNDANGFWIAGGNHRFIGCIAGGNAYNGFQLLDGESQYVGCAGWSNGYYGFYLTAGCNGLEILGQAYDNHGAGICLEETPPGYPPLKNLIYLNSYDNNKGVLIRGGSENIIHGLVTEVVKGKQPYGVVIEGGRNNILDLESFGHGSSDWAFTSGTYLLVGGQGLKHHGRAPVPEGAKSVTVAHGLVATPSSVRATPEWDTTCYLSAKNGTHVTFTFGTSAPPGAYVDWEADV